MNGSPAPGASRDQSLHAYIWKSSGSTTRADSFQSIVSARLTLATFTGCQLRFSTSVGRSSTFVLIALLLPTKRYLRTELSARIRIA
jgi:hypothetical protein